MTFTSLREILNYYLWWHQGFILILLEKIIWDPFSALLSTCFESLEFPTQVKILTIYYVEEEKLCSIFFLHWKMLETKLQKTKTSFCHIYLVPHIKSEHFWNHGQLHPRRMWLYPRSHFAASTATPFLTPAWLCQVQGRVTEVRHCPMQQRPFFLFWFSIF